MAVEGNEKNGKVNGTREPFLGVVKGSLSFKLNL